MRELNRTLSDQHQTWHDYKVVEAWLRVVLVVPYHAIWRVKEKVEAGKHQKVSHNVPWHSFADRRIDIVTAVANQRLENGVDYLTSEDDQAGLVL